MFVARTGLAGKRVIGQDGFTLVEMLVVITIIGLIMGLIGPRVLNYLGESKVKAARIQLQSFASALDCTISTLAAFLPPRKDWRHWSARHRALPPGTDHI